MQALLSSNKHEFTLPCQVSTRACEQKYISKQIFHQTDKFEFNKSGPSSMYDIDELLLIIRSYYFRRYYHVCDDKSPGVTSIPT